MSDLLTALRSCVSTGPGFTLSSGKKSFTYVDVRRLILDRRYAGLVVDEIAALPPARDVTLPLVYAGPVLAGAMLASALVAKRRCSYGLAVRTEPKGHGLKKRVEGQRVPPDSYVWLVDDVLTTGESLRRTAAALHDERGVIVRGATVVVDRSGGSGVDLPFPVRRLCRMDSLL